MHKTGENVTVRGLTPATHYVEVPAALSSGFYAAFNKNFRSIDEAGFTSGYLLVEVTTQHSKWFSGSRYTTQQYFIVTGPGGSQFRNLQDGLDHFPKGGVHVFKK